MVQLVRIGCVTKGHEDRTVRGYRKNEDGSETYLCSECFHSEGGLGKEETAVSKEKRADFLMFKRLLFQIRDGAVSEESYLYFLAGYFGVIPTSEDLKIPKKGCFKIEEKRR